VRSSHDNFPRTVVEFIVEVTLARFYGCERVINPNLFQQAYQFGVHSGFRYRNISLVNASTGNGGVSVS
jgi:hypothetical protein